MASDFFFISVGITALIILLTWLFVFYKIYKLFTLVELEIKTVKNTIKVGGLALISNLLSKIQQRR